MARVLGLGVLVLVGLAAGRAEAQARVTVVGWTDGGDAVLEIRDPMVDYRTEAWAAGAGETFRAVCTPAALDADEERCRLCAEATACPVGKAGKSKKAGKVAIKEQRRCAGPKKAPTSCDLVIKLGKLGAVTHALWKPRFQAVIDKAFRADGKAVVLTITNETAAGDVYDTFMVLALVAN